MRSLYVLSSIAWQGVGKRELPQAAF